MTRNSNSSTSVDEVTETRPVFVPGPLRDQNETRRRRGSTLSVIRGYTRQDRTDPGFYALGFRSTSV